MTECGGNPSLASGCYRCRWDVDVTDDECNLLHLWLTDRDRDHWRRNIQHVMMTRFARLMLRERRSRRRGSSHVL